MNGPCMEFCTRYLTKDEVIEKSILEVGSYNVNGSWKPIILEHNPSKYIGVDISSGPDVDEICDACSLIKKFGKNSFDIVLSAEMLEHASDWKDTIHNIKQVIKPNGIIMLSTRSYGFPYHGCPQDFSRFEAIDMIHIFSDFIIKAIIPDYVTPGIFVKAIKPKEFKEIDLSNYTVHLVNKDIGV